MLSACGLAGRPANAAMPYHYHFVSVAEWRTGGHFQISTATYEEILGLWWNKLNATSANQLRFT